MNWLVVVVVAAFLTIICAISAAMYSKIAKESTYVDEINKNTFRSNVMLSAFTVGCILIIAFAILGSKV